MSNDTTVSPVRTARASTTSAVNALGGRSGLTDAGTAALLGKALRRTNEALAALNEITFVEFAYIDGEQFLFDTSEADHASDEDQSFNGGETKDVLLRANMLLRTRNLSDAGKQGAVKAAIVLLARAASRLAVDEAAAVEAAGGPEAVAAAKAAYKVEQEARNAMLDAYEDEFEDEDEDEDDSDY